jgi:hypothetical protein
MRDAANTSNTLAVLLDESMDLQGRLRSVSAAAATTGLTSTEAAGLAAVVGERVGPPWRRA